MNLRSLRAWHRDVGYLVAGLTIAYALSGIAVNHVDAWNPKYAIEQRTIAIGALPDAEPTAALAAWEAAVVQRLELDPSAVRGRHAPSIRQFVVFLDGGSEVKVDPRSGDGTWKIVTPRRPLYEFHLLHLNTLKGAWTWVADLFGLALCFLALSGVLLPQGRLGLRGRGGWLLAAGLLAPTAALVLFYRAGS